MSSSCCTCSGGPTTKTMVVITYPRADMGDGKGNNTIVACDQTGAILWRYDTGNDANAHLISAGQPQIDSSGNVYVPWYATNTAGTSHAGVLKLDATGALLWNYDHGSGSGGDSTSIDRVLASDFDNSGRIVFRIPYHFSGTFNDEFALVVSTAGSLVTTYKWVAGGASGATVPLLVTFGIAVDGSGNLYVSTDSSANCQKFNSSGTFVSAFTSGSHQFLVCDKTNGKLYMYLSLSGGASSSATTLAQRWDLSTTTPTQDWTKSYDNIFHADTLDYTKSPGSTMGGIGFDPVTGTVSMAMGRAESNVGSTHVVSNILNLTASTGAKNFDVVIDTNVTGTAITGDFICVDPVGSGIYCGSKNVTTPNSYTIYCVTSGSLNWSNAALCPGGSSVGMAALTYTA